MAEHITGPGLMAEGLEVNERIGGKGVHVIPAKYMYPFHWLMTDPDSGGSEGVAHLQSSYLVSLSSMVSLLLAHSQCFPERIVFLLFELLMCRSNAAGCQEPHLWVF